ncbi:MAG: MarR family transcriptional regulator [Weeksellaceae bacterium]|nr:MarR family transcriptional regulator [Weeksellaceae bacterium]
MNDFTFKKYPTVDYMLRTTWNAVVKHYTAQAVKHDITMSLGFALLAIDPKVGTPSTALGPKMGMEPTSLSRTLKNLEERDLIRRKPNPKDARGVIIELTADGKHLRDNTREVVMHFNKVMEDEIGREKLNVFIEVAQQIRDLIAENKVNNISKSVQ